jgi:hypothetical protein
MKQIHSMRGKLGEAGLQTDSYDHMVEMGIGRDQDFGKAREFAGHPS